MDQGARINGGVNPSSRRRPFGVEAHRRSGRVIRLEGDQVQNAGLNLGRVLREHHRGEGRGSGGGGGRRLAATAIGLAARLPRLLVAVGIVGPERGQKLWGKEILWKYIHCMHILLFKVILR